MAEGKQRKPAVAEGRSEFLVIFFVLFLFLFFCFVFHSHCVCLAKSLIGSYGIVGEGEIPFWYSMCSS